LRSSAAWAALAPRHLHTAVARISGSSRIHWCRRAEAHNAADRQLAPAHLRDPAGGRLRGDRGGSSVASGDIGRILLACSRCVLAQPSLRRAALTPGLSCRTVYPTCCAVQGSRWSMVPEAPDPNGTSRSRSSVGGFGASGRLIVQEHVQRQEAQVCADLKLQEPMRGKNQLQSPNMQRAQARTSNGTSAPSFASSKPGGLANGHPCPNRKRNAGDAR